MNTKFLKLKVEILRKHVTKPFWIDYLFFLILGIIINFLFYQFNIFTFNKEDLYFDIIITIIDSAILASAFRFFGRYYLRKKFIND
ncbi:hypothetical protein D9V86_06900 [Bacteroidetes/Chlorobi group bacterium ChocPot_Mid]|jgi:hypothetical protein|nr:MAG: hypothetical protein D9V86_06900 [Bacteroidetes/Chlorobi group bacterium ChocPot_Mid]